LGWCWWMTQVIAMMSLLGWEKPGWVWFEVKIGGCCLAGTPGCWMSSWSGETIPTRRTDWWRNLWKLLKTWSKLGISILPYHFGDFPVRKCLYSHSHCFNLSGCSRPGEIQVFQSKIMSTSLS
jgi:hypothetical protein